MKSSMLKTHENCVGSISSTTKILHSKEPSRTRVRSWNHQWLLLCPVKLQNFGSGASNKIQTKLACILVADESTKMRMGNSEPPNHEDHIAGKGENSLQHYNLVHKIIPILKAIEVPAAETAVVQEWEKLGTISAWNLTKVKSKTKVIDGQGQGVPKACR